tara:strand:+ start:261 stop:1058 length:798 start_codon:yes stop_codon:yes gene_type:complete
MKYLGGKQRLGKHLAPVLAELWDPQQYNGYLEPFCGSLGVFKHMTSLPSATTIVANDYHPDLIAMWKAVQDDSMIYPNSISEEEYHEAKALPSPHPHKGFVGFGMSFGGRFFGAYSQKYLGNKKEDFCKEMVNSLKRIAPCIQKKKVKFTNKRYQTLHPKRKFIYCDPPYAKTNFPIKYRTHTKHYDTFDHDEFWDIMRKWSQQNDNFVVISETSAPPDFVEVWSMKRYRSAAQSTKTRFKGNPKPNSTIHDNEKLYVHESLVTT